MDTNDVRWALGSGFGGGCNNTHLLREVSGPWGLTPHSSCIPDPTEVNQAYSAALLTWKIYVLWAVGGELDFISSIVFAFLPTLMLTDANSAEVARETAQTWLSSQADVNRWLII